VRTALRWLRARSDLQLAGASVVLGGVWLVSLLFAGDAAPVLRVAQVLLGAVAAPALAILVGVRLVAPGLRLTHRLRRALQAASGVGVVSLALTANSFAVGFDDADAGRPSGLFASLTALFIVASVLGFAAAIALIVVMPIRRRLSVRAGVATAVLLGLVAAPFVAVTLLAPGAVIALSLIVFAYALLPRLSRTFTLPAAEREPVAVEPVRDRVILLAAVSLAITLIVWTAGFGTSVATSGTDVATSSLGIAAAAGQLAVVPLLWAASMLLGVRRPRTTATARIGVRVASVTVAVSVVAMVVAYSPAGDGFLLLVGLLSLGVGFWAASIVWALYAAFPLPARIATGVVTAVGVALVYALFAALTGGIVLAIASGFLAFGGARLLLRQSSPVETAG
jgi:hypothetical protein